MCAAPFPRAPLVPTVRAMNMTTMANAEVPAPPAWLNLDSLFPDREAWTESVAELAEEGRSLLPALSDFMQRATAAKKVFEDSVSPVCGVFDDPFHVIAPLVGMDAIDRVVIDLSTEVNGYDPGSHMGGVPEWAKETS